MDRSRRMRGRGRRRRGGSNEREGFISKEGVDSVGEGEGGEKERGREKNGGLMIDFLLFFFSPLFCIPSSYLNI